MTGMAQALGTLLSALIIPFVIQLIKTHTMSATAARWTALAVSLAAGIATGIAGGLPSNPGDWVSCLLAVVGGVQVAYTAFKNVGVTNIWLDALLGVGNTSNAKHA